MKRQSAHLQNRRFRLLFFLVPILLSVIGIFIHSLQNSKQNPASQAGYCCGDPQNTSGVFDSSEQLAYFMNEAVSPLIAELPEIIPDQKILGASSDNKWIDIDLATQTVRAMEGDTEVYRFLVSTGKWAPTPIGDFTIWSKFKYTKMSGGSKADNTYYYLPNVPFTMYFTSSGVGLHGAYWHNNFGHPMSHGCVNMAIPDAEKLFYWADPQIPSGKTAVSASRDNPGTRVIVHGIPPKS